MSGLLADDVVCVRGGRTLFDRLRLSLAPGNAALVTGPNGVGKSSLLRILAGLLTPSAGTIARDGAVAWLGEAHALDVERPLAHALAFWVGDEAEPALAAVGLAHLADVPVRVLSTGQRRRAGLARVIGARAPIWLLDEPANGLDAEGIVRLEAAIASHRAGGGIAVIATHQPVAVPDAVAVQLG